jgi:hypothetical protein
VLAKANDQEQNNMLLLSDTIKLTKGLKNGSLSIIDCAIKIAYRGRMYFAQGGTFAMLPLDHEQLARLHGMSSGMQRIDNSIYKCCVWKLYTNDDGEAPDWVLQLEGKHVVMSA